MSESGRESTWVAWLLLRWQGSNNDVSEGECLYYKGVGNDAECLSGAQI